MSQLRRLPFARSNRWWNHPSSPGNWKSLQRVCFIDHWRMQPGSVSLAASIIWILQIIGDYHHFVGDLEHLGSLMLWRNHCIAFLNFLERLCSLITYYFQKSSDDPPSAWNIADRILVVQVVLHHYTIVTLPHGYFGYCFPPFLCHRT